MHLFFCVKSVSNCFLSKKKKTYPKVKQKNRPAPTLSQLGKQTGSGLGLVPVGSAQLRDDHLSGESHRLELDDVHFGKLIRREQHQGNVLGGSCWWGRNWWRLLLAGWGRCAAAAAGATRWSCTQIENAIAVSGGCVNKQRFWFAVLFFPFLKWDATLRVMKKPNWYLFKQQLLL